MGTADALEFWSGAVFKSTLHRVVLPTPLPANGIPERYSMAWFNQPSPEAVFKVSSPRPPPLAKLRRRG